MKQALEIRIYHLTLKCFYKENVIVFSIIYFCCSYYVTLKNIKMQQKSIENIKTLPKTQYNLQKQIKKHEMFEN